MPFPPVSESLHVLPEASAAPLRRALPRRRASLPANAHGAFRILLHVLRLQVSGQESALCSRSTQAGDALACLRERLDEAQRRHEGKDGFGYEMALLRLARATFAALEAHHQRVDWTASREGRTPVSQIHRYVPKTEWLMTQMQRLAHEEHGDRAEDWPSLDLQQHQELQGLLDGLVTAYLEREGVLPEFSRRARGARTLHQHLTELVAEPPRSSAELR